MIPSTQPPAVHPLGLARSIEYNALGPRDRYHDPVTHIDRVIVSSPLQTPNKVSGYGMGIAAEQHPAAASGALQAFDTLQGPSRSRRHLTFLSRIPVLVFQNPLSGRAIGIPRSDAPGIVLQPAFFSRAQTSSLHLADTSGLASAHLRRHLVVPHPLAAEPDPPMSSRRTAKPKTLAQTQNKPNQIKSNPPISITRCINASSLVKLNCSADPQTPAALTDAR
ncbi:hypothetical protein EW146_g8985 [Bondarzewia mesenterica]|uniref:Uncharacterized protein n=1 Tax=Bondarzewia mesenterica TaxID=1095465 RepID=A0A4S4LAC5_9AGAM|nr:hypothetical protein EW146_g8985 [Bondarzewia mesenterica]